MTFAQNLGFKKHSISIEKVLKQKIEWIYRQILNISKIHVHSKNIKDISLFHVQNCVASQNEDNNRFTPYFKSPIQDFDDQIHDGGLNHNEKNKTKLKNLQHIKEMEIQNLKQQLIQVEKQCSEVESNDTDRIELLKLHEQIILNEQQLITIHYMLR